MELKLGFLVHSVPLCMPPSEVAVSGGGSSVFFAKFLCFPLGTHPKMQLAGFILVLLCEGDMNAGPLCTANWENPHVPVI